MIFHFTLAYTISSLFNVLNLNKIHRVKGQFGVATGTSMKLYTDTKFNWRALDAIHLLINHRHYRKNIFDSKQTIILFYYLFISVDPGYKAIPVFDDRNITTYKFPFGEMARETMTDP